MKGGNLSCGNELPLIYHNIYNSMSEKASGSSAQMMNQTTFCFLTYSIPHTAHSLNKRWFECSVCGYRVPRDVHAARNMIRLGGKPKTPVECGGAPVEAVSDSSERLLVKQETDGAEKSLGAEASGSSAQM